MQKKFIIILTLFISGLFSTLLAESDHDFKIRIFDIKGGERTSGTQSILIENLKGNRSSVGGTFTQHTKNGDVYTGIQIRWKEEKSGIHTFTAKIKQSDGTVAAVIETEFQYKGVAEEIYSNKFHTIKIIPKGKE